MRKTILVVEDEEHVGDLVRRYFEHAGFQVVWAQTGEEALIEFDRRPADAVVLDLGLPGMDGFAVCRELRERSKVPVIMLTAWDDEPDRVAGLEVGADDYVTKPFSPRELVARIRAVFRRVDWEQEGPSLLAVGNIELDSLSHEASVGGQKLDLTAKEFALLQAFLEQPGVALSRERLLEMVWRGELLEGTRTVDVHVGQLRRKLGNPGLLKTVRGVGYKLARPPDRV